MSVSKCVYRCKAYMCTDLVEAVSELLEQGSIAELKDSPAFGVSCDKSSHISSVKQLLVFVTFPKAACVDCVFLTVVKPRGFCSNHQFCLGASVG